MDYRYSLVLHFQLHLDLGLLANLRHFVFERLDCLRRLNNRMIWQVLLSHLIEWNPLVMNQLILELVERQ